MDQKMTRLAPTPWASVRDGKWHRTAQVAQNFSDPVHSLCGITFVPLNVQDSKFYPDHTNPRGVCKHCLPLAN